MSFEEDTTEAHERRITRCRSCRAQVIWLDNPAPGGKKMIVDADSVSPDDETYDSTKHISHFATCPDAGKWRKPR